jgi:hypothetical protein
MDILVEAVQAVMELRGIKNNTAPINPQMQPFTCWMFYAFISNQEGCF